MFTEKDWEELKTLYMLLDHLNAQFAQAVMDKDFNECLRCDEKIKFIHKQIHNQLGKMYDPR